MIYYKKQDEIEFIRQNCLLVCKTLAHVASQLKPGVKAKDLDDSAESFIRDHGAEPGFKGYGDFPATLCFSINECVVHGIPNEQVVKEGDVVSVDCGVFHNNYYGDAAYTFAVGEVNDDIMKLLWTTKESLRLAIESARAGNRLGDIGYAVQNLAEKENNYGVVRSLVGHGIGRNLHEKPEVPNFGRRGRGIQLKEGLVIAIEPMVNMGTQKVVLLDDGWSIVTKDGLPSAHYEHTIAIQKGGADILSDHDIIEEQIKNNINLTSISLKN